MTDIAVREPGSKLNVYFIDDSATMREVVKNAFRHENFNVVACSDMTSAVAQFEQTAPDVVISDVIMPDNDGYSLCQYVKEHPEFSGTPVFLMSGVVNKEVADRAHDVKADELIRKPFHPQELVARVKKVLHRSEPEQAPPAQSEPAPINSLSQLFGTAAPVAFQPRPAPVPADTRPRPQVQPPPQAPQAAPPAAVARHTPASSSQDSLKLSIEVRRLESLVKKLQSDLASEREYSAALESQLRVLSTAE